MCFRIAEGKKSRRTRAYKVLQYRNGCWRSPVYRDEGPTWKVGQIAALSEDAQVRSDHAYTLSSHGLYVYASLKKAVSIVKGWGPDSHAVFRVHVRPEDHIFESSSDSSAATYRRIKLGRQVTRLARQ